MVFPLFSYSFKAFSSRFHLILKAAGGSGLAGAARKALRGADLQQRRPATAAGGGRSGRRPLLDLRFSFKDQVAMKKDIYKWI